jgi:hypothetical protein
MPSPDEVPPRPTVARAMLITWLVTATWDFFCASGLTVFVYESTFARLWQGVAAVAYGPQMIDSGPRGVLLGLAAHLAVAFTWSALFVGALAVSARLRRAIAGQGGAIAVACLYGPIIWLGMSLGVIPFLTGRPPTFNDRWWIQVFAHIPFVAMPLVWTARRVLVQRA